MPRFAYFTLRLQVPDDSSSSAGVSTGVVEDLATGEKRIFSGGRELLDVLGVDHDRTKMQPGEDPGQTRAD